MRLGRRRHGRLSLLVYGTALVALVAWSAADHGPLLWVFANLGVAVPIFIVSLVLHEAAHALVGTWVGAPPRVIRLGVGEIRAKRRVGPVAVFVHTLPFAGYVVPEIRGAAWFRTRWILVIAAGPSVHALLAWGLWGHMESAGLGSALAPLKVTCFVQVWMLFVNLLPTRLRSGPGSDGLQLLRAPFVKPAELAQMRATGHLLRAQAAAELEDPAESEAQLVAAESLGLELPEVRYLRARAEMAQGKWEDARTRLQAVLPSAPGRLRTEIANTLAWIAVVSGRAELLEEADALSAAALEEREDDAVRGTRGAVLIRRGRLEEGLPLLYPRMADEASASHVALQAEALARMGRLEDARAALAEARARRAEPELLAAAERALEEASARAAS